MLMTGLAASVMWQYYVLDVEREKGALKSGKIVPWSGPGVAGKSIIALAEIVKTSSVVAGLKGRLMNWVRAMTLDQTVR